MLSRTFRSVLAAAALAATASCSGGGGSAPLGAAPPGTPATPGAGAPRTTAAVRVTGTIFIPGHAAGDAANAAVKATAARRSPQYLSAATRGIAIATATASGTPIDATAFATDVSTNPMGCKAASGGTTCTFAVNAAPPATRFAVTAYDAAPAQAGTPQGTALATGSSTAAIAAGTANTVALTLGGVVARYTLALLGSSTATMPAVGATSTISVPAENVPTTLRIGIAALDAQGKTIVTMSGAPSAAAPQTAYANPITFTLAELHSAAGAGQTSTSHATLALETSDGAGTATTAPGPTVTSKYSTDTLTLAYDGIDLAAAAASSGTPYSATVTGSAPAATDAFSGAQGAAVASEVMTLAPLFIAATPTSGSTYVAPGPAASPAAPTVSFSIPMGGKPPTTVTAYQAATPTGSTGYTLAGDAANTCTNIAAASASAQTATPASFTFGQGQTTTPNNGQCVFELADGTSTVDPIDVYALNANGTVALHHIWLIILENQSEDNTFGSNMPVPYLSKTMAAQGGFVPNYWGTSHNSLGNYISLMSGQSVTNTNQNDCLQYTSIAVTGNGPYGQIGGNGCVYPATTKSYFDQLAGASFTYKGYMEDMGKTPGREAATCGQTFPEGATTAATGTGMAPPAFVAGSPVATGDVDDTEVAAPTDQYAMRHNPFDYFDSIVPTPACGANVVPLTMATLSTDVAKVSTTPNFSFITPNLCDDGHDVPCTAAGANGDTNSSLDNENAFLSQYVPLITRSAAFKQDGLLIITFDEASPTHVNGVTGTDATSDASSCCNESTVTLTNTVANAKAPGYPTAGATPNPAAATNGSNTQGHPNDGSGGGRTGTMLVSPFISPGSTTGSQYNHYALLHSLEDEFGFAYLGNAGYPGTTPIGPDVYGTTPARYPIAL